MIALSCFRFVFSPIKLSCLEKTQSWNLNLHFRCWKFKLKCLLNRPSAKCHQIISGSVNKTNKYFTIISGWLFWKLTHGLQSWKDWHFRQSWLIDSSSMIFLSTCFQEYWRNNFTESIYLWRVGVGHHLWEAHYLNHFTIYMYYKSQTLLF